MEYCIHYRCSVNWEIIKDAEGSEEYASKVKNFPTSVSIQQLLLSKQASSAGWLPSEPSSTAEHSFRLQTFSLSPYSLYYPMDSKAFLLLSARFTLYAVPELQSMLITPARENNQENWSGFQAASVIPKHACKCLELC